MLGNLSSGFTLLACTKDTNVFPDCRRATQNPPGHRLLYQWRQYAPMYIASRMTKASFAT